MKHNKGGEIMRAVKKIFDKKQLKQKETLLHTGESNVRTRMFRSDDLKRCLEEKEIEVIGKQYNIAELTNLQNFIDYLLDNGILLRLQREDEHVKGDKLKWPKRMEICSSQKYDPNLLNFFSFSKREATRSWKAYTIVALILLVFMYPIWPFSVRLIAFYVCFYLTVAFAIFQVIRLLLYYVLRLLGYEFWILPNINENQMSLKPIYTFVYSQDKWVGLVARIILAISTVIGIYLVFRSPQNREDMKFFLDQSHDHMLAYGLEKIKFNYTFDSSKSISFEALLEDDDNLTSSDAPTEFINSTSNNSEQISDNIEYN